MKDPNGFDELARRKLAERDFAFDQSHWTDMEHLLAERDRKPKAWWPWMAAGVLLLGGGALWAGMEETSSASEPSVSVVGSAAPQAATNGPVRSGAITAPTEAALTPTTEKPPPEQERAVEPTTAGTSTTPTKQVSTNVGKSNIPTATPQAHPKVTPKMMPTPMAAAPVTQHSGPGLAITTVITAAPTNIGVASEGDATGHPSEAPGT